MSFLYKYDESKVRMQNVTKELFQQTPEKFPLSVQSVTNKTKKLPASYFTFVGCLNVLNRLTNSKSIIKHFNLVYLQANQK